MGMNEYQKVISTKQEGRRFVGYARLRWLDDVETDLLKLAGGIERRVTQSVSLGSQRPVAPINVMSNAPNWPRTETICYQILYLVSYKQITFIVHNFLSAAVM